MYKLHKAYVSNFEHIYYLNTSLTVADVTPAHVGYRYKHSPLKP